MMSTGDLLSDHSEEESVLSKLELSLQFAWLDSVSSRDKRKRRKKKKKNT